ncbi:ribonuclease H-like domain-containing protein [Tanacetum coccineum]
MAVEDNPPPPSSTDKIIPFSIPNKVPIKLDLEKHNYNSWSSFSLIHFGSLGLKSHVEEETASTNSEWCQLDDLIKMWILGSLCDSLQEQVLTTPGNAKALWDHLKDLFHDNKDARAINLDNELRSIKSGTMTINEYCTKIKSMSNRLKNLDCQSHPLMMTPTLLLILRVARPHLPFSSSTSSRDKGNANKPSNLPQICNHFNRGTCKFGDRCKFIHDHRNRAGLSSQRNFSCSNVSSYAGIWSTSSGPSHVRPVHTQPLNQTVLYQPCPTITAGPIAYYAGPAPTTYTAQQPQAHYLQHHRAPVQQTQPVHHQPLTYAAQQQPAHYGQPDILGPAPAVHPSQATSLPYAFSTMTLQDPTWNMDTCASFHLNSNASNLSTIFNQCLFPSVHVGDGNSIPVTNTGHIIILSLHRPLHLHNVLVTPNIIKNLISVCQFTRDNNCTIEFDAFGFFVKDFLTRHILLRCDSSAISIQLPSCQLSLLFLFPLVPPLGINASVILGMKCFVLLLPHKFHADGTLSRYKARLVANGSSQQLGIDFDETFSPVVKPATIRTILSLVVSRQWPVHQLDVKNAFLNGDLSKTVYMHQPPGFVDSWYPNHLCLLQRSLYGLKQAPRAWFQWFAGFSDRSSTGLFLSQRKYTLQLLERAHMVNCNPSRTPVDTESKLGPEGVPVQDPTLYRSLAGGLQYLTFTHPDLSYVVQQVCLYMHDPREPHFASLKRILRYVRGTVDFGLQLYVSSTTSLVGYTDADWAGCPSTRRSTSGYWIFLGDNFSSWSSKRQHTLSHSSAEAEYRGVANVVAKTAWLRNLLRELHYPLSTATIVYCDNVSAVYLSANHVQHQRMKHIEIDIHFVRDMVTVGQVKVLNLPSSYQYADIFTKGLSSALFEDFRSSLSVLPPPVQTTGAY